MNLSLILPIAFGGALGAVLRHVVNSAFALATFPWATLVVNLVGSFILAVIVELGSIKMNLSPEMRAFLVVGFCGALTTFSTFAMDATLLYGRGEMLKAFVYVSASIVFSLGAFMAGLYIIRKLFI